MTAIFNRKTFVILGSVLLLGAAASGFLLLRHHSAATAPSAPFKPVIAADALFSFKASKAPAWQQGPTNKTSLVLFTKQSGCFASVELKTGAVDETQELSKVTTGFSTLGYEVTSLDPIDTAFAVGASPAGAPYRLRPYTLSGTGDHGYKTQVFGYVPLTGKYINVQAYCSDNTTFSQIAATLSAITLKAQ